MYLVSTGLIFSYVLDWLTIIFIGLVGCGLNFIEPAHRPFILSDNSISFPLVNALIPSWLLGVCSVLGPTVIISFVTILFVPGYTLGKGMNVREKWTRKLWELNCCLMGLGLSQSVSFVITQGFKILFAKPRPNFLAICNPDKDVDEWAFAINSQGHISPWSVPIVDSRICNVNVPKELNDAYKSFPSGHAAASWAGMLYLNLFLCAKFSVAFPRSFYARGRRSRTPSEKSGRSSSREDRESAASPPLFLVIIILIPIGVAIFLSTTGYLEYYHSAIDVFAGSLIGIIISIGSFKLFHMPISQGGSWAWGARSPSRAFGIDLGQTGFVSCTAPDSRRTLP